MKKLYFENSDSPYCYEKSYFIQKMIKNGLTQIEVYKAEKEKVPGVAWCKEFRNLVEKNDVFFSYWNFCGKQCEKYAPRNGVSGCCKHYTKTLYEKGEKTIIYL